MVMLSSVINVVQKTPNVLQIHVPASHLEAGIEILGAAVLLITALASFRRKFQFVLFLVLGAFLAWMGVSSWSSECTAILSAVDQTLTIERTSSFGAYTDSYPLNSVSQAVVESDGRGNHDLFIETKDGKQIIMTTYTTRDGCNQAQQAINTFLAHHVAASPAAPAPGSNTPPGSTQ